MKAFLKKFKSYKVWVAIIGAVLLFIQALGVKVDVPVLKEALLAVCALLVTLGILTNPDKNYDKEEKNKIN
jgi:uncharacterized membrane protein